MKDGLRSIFTAAGVSAGCLCIWWGSNLRDHVEVGNARSVASSSGPVVKTVVASRDNGTVNVPAVDYYAQMVSLLKKYYVEQISDDQKLANGAVRGMIASLNDPQSMYMEPDDFRAYTEREQGKYEGIGVDLALSLHGDKDTSKPGALQPPPEDAEEAVATLSRFPKVVVVGVVPGGPADKAGVKVGDSVADIDGHWVVDEGLLNRFKQATHAFNEKKITFSQIEPLQKDLREKTERALLPVKTLSKLMTGTNGTVNVVWKRKDVSRSTKLMKTTSLMPGFSAGNVIVLPMDEQGRTGLKAALAGKSSVTIDLTHDSEGSFSSMLGCLQLLATSGHYGQITNHRSEDPTPLVVQSGNENPPKINLLVGRSTRGPAEIFALALAKGKRVTITGGPMGGNAFVKQDVQLPGGAGYDLTVGTYQSSTTQNAGTKRHRMASSGLSGPGLTAENLRRTAVPNLARPAISEGGVK